METITTVPKRELIARIAVRSNVTAAQADAVVIALLEEVQAAVAEGHKVTLPRFGTFEPRERQARTARNPRTGEEIPVEARRAPGFKAAAGFKQRVNDGA